MSVETLSLVITALWLVIYTLDRLCNHDSNGPRNLPLPVGVPSTRLRSSTSSTHIIIQHLHLRIQTNAFNKLHQRLCARFANRRFALAKKSLTVFYDAGSMFGVLGMLGALGIVIWTAGDLVRLLFGWNFTLLVEAGSGYGKRSLDAVAAPTMQTHKSSSGSLLKPIVSNSHPDMQQKPTKALQRAVDPRRDSPTCTPSTHISLYSRLPSHS